MVWFWDHYAPDAGRRSEPDASPLQAADASPACRRPSCSPPSTTCCATRARPTPTRLREAGVPVDFRRHAGQTHGFFTILLLPGSERGFQQVVKAVRACTVRHAQASAAAQAS